SRRRCPGSLHSAPLLFPGKFGKPRAALCAGVFSGIAGACRRSLRKAGSVMYKLCPTAGGLSQHSFDHSEDKTGAGTLGFYFLHAADELANFIRLAGLGSVLKIIVKGGDGFVEVSSSRVKLAPIKLHDPFVRVAGFRGAIQLLFAHSKLVGFNASNTQV